MEYNFVTQDDADKACRAIARAIGGVLVESEYRGHVRLHFPDSAVLDFEVLVDEYYEPYLSITILQ